METRFRLFLYDFLKKYIKSIDDMQLKLNKFT